MTSFAGLRTVFTSSGFTETLIFVGDEAQARSLFLRVILPRVLVGQMDKKNASPTTDESVFCYCRKGEEGDMIACDNPTCDYEWFHFSCVGLKSEP